MVLRIYGLKDRTFQKIAMLGARNNSLADKLCAFLLALCPIIQFYKGIYQNAGFTVLILLFPYIAIKFIRVLNRDGIDKRCLTAILPMILFQAYKMVDHSINMNRILYGVFFIFLFLAVAVGCINVGYFIKYAVLIGTAAGVLLLIQYICYYILGFHLQLAPTSLFLKSSAGWIAGAQTGLYGIRGLKNDFYRPCAFFMEPSHLFLYCFPILCLMLFSQGQDRARLRYAGWITLAMFLSTSGMGVVCSVAVWIVYFALYRSKDNKRNVARWKNMLTVRNLSILIGVVLALVILYFTVPVFGKTVDRFLKETSTGGSSAVDGRNRLARGLIRSITGSARIFGVSETLDVSFNMPGFYATFYKFGWIGVILSYWYYGQFVFRVRGSGFWISLIVLIVSFFSAHTHGTFYMMYFIIVQMNAMYMHGRERIAVSDGYFRSSVCRADVNESERKRTAWNEAIEPIGGNE